MTRKIVRSLVCIVAVLAFGAGFTVTLAAEILRRIWGREGTPDPPMVWTHPDREAPPGIVGEA